MEIIRKLFKTENKRWLTASFLVSAILLAPLVMLCLSVFNIESSVFWYLWDNLLLDYSLNTLYLIFITSVFSLIFGVIPAWFVSNYDFKFRRFFDVALFLPLAIPTYIMAFTYSEMLSFTGPLQSFLRKNIPSVSDSFNVDYLQIEVLGVLLALSLYPYIYTACRLSFSLIGSTYINMSKNLGLSGIKLFYKVILPLSRPAIFSGLFLVIMEVLNEYGAVEYFGVNTFTTGIFRAWFSMDNEASAIQLACLLLLVVFVILLAQKFLSKKTKFYYSKNSATDKLSPLAKYNRFYVYCSCLTPFLLGFVIPLIYITTNFIASFEEINFSKLLSLSKNSVSVSALSSLIIICIAILFLYVEKISKLSVSKTINQTTSLGYVIPGAIIGLAMILLFTKTSFLQSIHGSFYVLIYAYIFRFLAVGKSPIKSSLEKHPDSFDETAKTLGLGPLKILRKVYFPINKLAIVIAFIVTFVDLLKELPITLILRPFNFDTLATQTYQFAKEEQMATSAVYSLAIIIIGAVMLIILKSMVNKQINAS